VHVGLTGKQKAKEAQARILINDLLERSGWQFFDDETGPANIALEVNVKSKKTTLVGLGDDYEKTANGYTDNLLLDALFALAGFDRRGTLLS
jgi:type I restriction enzyme R subunit